MNITRLSDGFAADIEGVDLAVLDGPAFAALHAAWLEHLVVRVRGQHLDDDALQRFSARFGPLEYRPMGKVTQAQRDAAPFPFVTVISNIVDNGRPIGGLGAAEAQWHSDMTYIPEPPTASILHALEVPPSGGDTWFADMHAALEVLPAELRQRIEGLQLKHDAAHDSVGNLRRGHSEAATPRDAPGAVHPLIRRHPQTGRDALYLGRRQDAWIVGLPVPESEALLDEIWSWAALPRHCWCQQWRVGDVVIWDNRAVMHRRDGFDASERRLMHRTQVRCVPD